MTTATNVDTKALVQRIREIVDEEDIPVLGVAPSEGMESEPSGIRPSDILPGARSVLCFGLAVPAGVYGAAAHQTETVWRTQNIYYRRLDTLSLRVG